MVPAGPLASRGRRPEVRRPAWLFQLRLLAIDSMNTSQPATAQAVLEGEALHAFMDQAHDLLQRSEEHTSELQSPCNLVCRLLLEKKKNAKPQKVRDHQPGLRGVLLHPPAHP